MRRLLTALAAAAALAAAPAATAETFAPPAGEVWAGVTGGRDVSSFEREVGKHPPVFQFFSSWDQPAEWMFEGAARSRARLMIHVSTQMDGHEAITPRGIARGRGDAYLIRLVDRIAAGGTPTYVRLMSEMNGHWNAYSAFTASGRSRGAEHSTAAFRAAWRRSVLILRGGPVAEIDARLRALRLPPVNATRAELPRPPVSVMWVPQTAGSPPIAANAPRAYWPGGEYVDWVGTDFYSKFPNFAGLDRFYREFRGKPFVFGEWAMWGRDDPAFVGRLFSWVRARPRVRMLMYNQGNQPAGPFRLSRYPRARQALARELAAPRFAEHAPEFRP